MKSITNVQVLMQPYLIDSKGTSLCEPFIGELKIETEMQIIMMEHMQRASRFIIAKTLIW